MIGLIKHLYYLGERNKLFSFEILRRHYSLYPVIGCIVVGSAWAVIFGVRTLVFNPDSTLQGRTYFERYRDGTYFKMINVTGYKPPCYAPEYRREGDPSDDSYALADY